jgi:hypothetical protein
MHGAPVRWGATDAAPAVMRHAGAAREVHIIDVSRSDAANERVL